MTGPAREALRKELDRDEARKKRRRTAGTLGIVTLVLALVIASFWAIGSSRRSGSGDADAGASSAHLAGALTSIPASTFDAIGAGDAKTPPQAIPQSTPANSPRVLYIGAEYCPFCAIERLPLTAALARFGSFQGLTDSLSSPNEGQLSNIPSVSFKNFQYKSDHLTFSAVETADRMGNKLATVPPDDEKIFRTHAPEGGIPFVYYGTAFSNGATYDGRNLAGRDAAELATALRDPNSSETRQVVGAANVLTAQICKETKNQPAAVCNSAGVTAARALLK